MARYEPLLGNDLEEFRVDGWPVPDCYSRFNRFRVEEILENPANICHSCGESCEDAPLKCLNKLSKKAEGERPLFEGVEENGKASIWLADAKK
jgi:hypothetical protein